MERLRTVAARLRRDEGGYMLTELLVAAILAMVVIGSAVMIFTTAVRSQPRITERTSQIQQARTFAESISRELRQGWGATTTATSQLAILTYVKRATCAGAAAGAAIPCRVTYTCSAGACSRVVANPDGTGAGTAVAVVHGLADANVFTYSPDAANPTYVGIRLSFPAEGAEDAITLNDGVAMRNDTPPDAPEA